MKTEQEQIKDLNRALAGWTVVRFDPIDHCACDKDSAKGKTPCTGG